MSYKPFIYPSNISNHGYRTKALAIEKQSGSSAAIKWLNSVADPEMFLGITVDNTVEDFKKQYKQSDYFSDLQSAKTTGALAKWINADWVNSNNFKPFKIGQCVFPDKLLQIMRIMGKQARKCPQNTIKINRPLPANHSHKDRFQSLNKRILRVYADDNETNGFVQNHFRANHLVDLKTGCILTVSSAKKPVDDTTLIHNLILEDIPSNLFSTMTGKSLKWGLNRGKTIGKGPFIQYGPTGEIQYTGDGLRPWQLDILNCYRLK